MDGPDDGPGGVEHERVDASQTSDGGIDAGLDTRPRAHVALDIPVHDVGREDGGALLPEPARDRGADSRAAAGHERALAVQASHDFLRVAC